MDGLTLGSMEFTAANVEQVCNYLAAISRESEDICISVSVSV